MYISEHMPDRIAEHFPLVPPYLAAVSHQPALFERLWQQTLVAFVHNPLPVLLREKLFAVFSAHQRIPCCQHYHLYTLLSLGLQVEACMSLLTAVPGEEEIKASLDRLAVQPAPLPGWPAPGDVLEEAFFWAALSCLLSPGLAGRARRELRRLLAGEQYDALFELLSFVRTCHLWIETYPERAREADEVARHRLAVLLGERYSKEEQARIWELLARLEVWPEETAEVQELEIYRSRLSAVLDAIGDGVLLYDRRGRLVYLNGVAQRWLPIIQPGAAHLGLALDAGHGASFPDAPLYRPLRRTLEEGHTIVGEQAIDVRVALENGEELVLNLSGVPVRGVQGRVIGAVLIMREVTARHCLEQRAHEALDALLAMAEALVQEPVPESPATEVEGFQVDAVMQRMVELTWQVLACRRVVILGLERDTERIQRIALTGATPQQEQRWREIVLSADLGEFLMPALMERLRAGESVLVDLEEPEFEHLRQRVESYIVRTILVIPMRLRERLIGVLTVDYGAEEHSYSAEELALAAAVARLATLVLEREQLLEERAEARASVLALRQANRRMDEFISFASHELRAPLTVLKANAQLIKRHLQKASVLGRGLDNEAAGGALRERLAAIPELLDRSIRQVDLLDRLVGDLLDFSRIQSATLQLVLKPQDLGQIVCDVVQAQQQVYPARDIRLSMEVSGPVLVNVDAVRIGQVLTNYIQNAIRYAPPERPIEVRLRLEDGWVRVLVRDEGPGLAPEIQERVWERFYRAPGIPVQEGSPVGLGLGLHICQTIIQLHHGQVGVESVPGQGATFWFRLPLHEG